MVRRVSSHNCSNLHVIFVGFVNALHTSKIGGPLSASPTTSSAKSAVLHSEVLRTQECVTPKRQSATFESYSFIFLLHICFLNCFSVLHRTSTHKRSAQTRRSGRTCGWLVVFLFAAHETQRAWWLVCLLPLSLWHTSHALRCVRETTWHCEVGWAVCACTVSPRSDTPQTHVAIWAKHTA